MKTITYTCGTCGNRRELKFRAGRVNLSKDCHRCAGRKIFRPCKHGGVGTALYSVWCGIKNRCYWKDGESYKYYGGRGVKVCSEWLHDFVSFRDWAMRNGYARGLVIDRINSAADYSPDNCRWVTPARNQNNTSRVYLTPAGAAVIRGLYRAGVARKLIAALYDIPINYVSSIKGNHAWRGAEPDAIMEIA